MKKLFFAALFMGGMLAAKAQDQPAAPVDPNGPKISFTSEEIDYGKIKQGADGKRVFAFKNTGKSPLILSSCRGSCGCTVPTCPQEPILPGKTGKIDVQYDTQRVGGFTKTVTVTSNAVDFPTKVIKIKGEVEAPAAAPAAPAPAGH